MARTNTKLATILSQLPAAHARSASERQSGRRARSARYDRRTRRVLVELSNGCLFGFPVSALAALETASPADCARVKVSPGGGALHWRALDVDLSVPGLLLAFVGRPRKRKAE